MGRGVRSNVDVPSHPRERIVNRMRVCDICGISIINYHCHYYYFLLPSVRASTPKFLMGLEASP